MRLSGGNRGTYKRWFPTHFSRRLIQYIKFLYATIIFIDAYSENNLYLKKMLFLHSA